MIIENKVKVEGSYRITVTDKDGKLREQTDEMKNLFTNVGLSILAGKCYRKYSLDNTTSPMHYTDMFQYCAIGDGQGAARASNIKMGSIVTIRKGGLKKAHRLHVNDLPNINDHTVIMETVVQYTFPDMDEHNLTEIGLALNHAPPESAVGEWKKMYELCTHSFFSKNGNPHIIKTKKGDTVIVEYKVRLFYDVQGVKNKIELKTGATAQDATTTQTVECLCRPTRFNISPNVSDSVYIPYIGELTNRNGVLGVYGAKETDEEQYKKYDFSKWAVNTSPAYDIANATKEETDLVYANAAVGNDNSAVMVDGNGYTYSQGSYDVLPIAVGDDAPVRDLGTDFNVREETFEIPKDACNFPNGIRQVLYSLNPFGKEGKDYRHMYHVLVFADSKTGRGIKKTADHKFVFKVRTVFTQH